MNVVEWTDHLSPLLLAICIGPGKNNIGRSVVWSAEVSLYIQLFEHKTCRI